MEALYVRNFPDDLHKKMRIRAVGNFQDEHCQFFLYALDDSRDCKMQETLSVFPTQGEAIHIRMKPQRI